MKLQDLSSPLVLMQFHAHKVNILILKLQWKETPVSQSPVYRQLQIFRALDEASYVVSYERS